MRVVDGNVYWRENTNELRYSVTDLTLTTGGIGSGEPVAFDAALNFANETSGLTAAVAASAVVTAAPNGAVTATDVDTSVTLNAGGGAPARELEATATRVAFDRTAESLAVEALVTEIAGIRAAWQLSGSTLLDQPDRRGSVTVERGELATVFEQLRLSPPASLEPSELGPFALTGRVQFPSRATARAVVRRASAELLGMNVTGEGSLAGGNELAGHVVVAEFTPNAAVQALLRASRAADRRRRRSRHARARRTLRHQPRLRPRGAARLLVDRARRHGSAASSKACPGERGNVFRGSHSDVALLGRTNIAKAFAALLPPNLAPSELGMIELETHASSSTRPPTR